MEKKEKPKWSRPMLTVLFRGDRQESIMDICKYLFWGSDGTSKVQFASCNKEVCAQCTDNAAS